MEPPVDVSDVWGVLAAVVTTTGTVLIAWLTARAKRGSDRQDEEAAPVIESAEQNTNLQAVVDHLVEQMAQVQSELIEIRPIRDVKYPFALDHIRHLRRAHPDTRITVPRQIIDDL